jgi:murein DD-endopeptidase MepM/ murein hydrolase activator NlpD
MVYNYKRRNLFIAISVFIIFILFLIHNASIFASSLDEGLGSASSGKLLNPVAGSVITSGFGSRLHPILGYIKTHCGVDLAAPRGTPIVAADGGQIMEAGYEGGYGKSILIDHGGGFETFYAHLLRFAVKLGQIVQRGEIIGYVGSSGLATGPHCHFEVRLNSIAQNPLGYL